MEVLHAPFVQAPLPLVDSGEMPHLQFAPCMDAQCARCDGCLGGFKFPFIGTWCRRAVLVQEGASAEEAWAAYHGCYEEDRLSEAMVAEAGSGLRAQDVIPMYVSAIAGRVESGNLPFVSFRASWGPGGDGAWALGGGPSHGPGRAEAGLTLCALHVASINAKPAPSAAAKALRWGALLLAMAFRGEGAMPLKPWSTPGATRAALAKG